MAGQGAEWFKSWFNSKYYPMLYRHRSLEEADFFVENLLTYLDLPSGSEVLDLACGRGRHSISLHRMGYRVTGIDLSEESIADAKKHESDGLHFQVSDMRYFELNKQFDAVLNLFTSFGYFSDPSENLLVLGNVRKHLREEGQFVLDYFNDECVRAQLVPTTEMNMDGVLFSVQKRIEQNMVIKHIHVEDHGAHFDFEERVQLFSADELKRMIESAGMEVLGAFGNYSLDPYEPSSSPRLILHCTL